MTDNKTVFEDERIVLTEIVGVIPPAMLDGLTFTRCEIVGPAVLAIAGPNKFNGCKFETPDVFITLDPGRKYFGMIGIRNSRFLDCEFRNVGIAGNQDFVNRFLANVMND